MANASPHFHHMSSPFQHPDFSNLKILGTGRDSVLGVATRYGLDRPGFSAPVQTGPGAHPASYAIDTGSLPGVKRPGRGVDHPPHLAPKLKKEWCYTSTPPLGLHGL